MDHPLWRVPSTKTLTSSQSTVLRTCLKVLPNFKIVVIKGESDSGKYVVAQELFTASNAAVINFNFFDMQNLPLSNFSMNAYLESLRRDVNLAMVHDNKSYGIIYIRNYNRVADVLMDSNDKHRHLWLLTLKSFIETMDSRTRIIITTQGCLLPESLHWCCTLTTTRSDMSHVLSSYVEENIITTTQSEHILKNSRVVPVGRMLYCLKYAMSIQDDGGYDRALAKFAGPIITGATGATASSSNLDLDLIGLEDLISEITTAVITPIKLGSKIPIKPGIVICGPPGTGKTSIGRWLANQLPGKFYTVSGTEFVFDLQRTIEQAREHAPAVIFVDDCDSLFESETHYRAFRTSLDGLEFRHPLCFVITCMNLKSIPSALLRGGRLELTLITRLPAPLHLQSMLTCQLNRILTVLPDISYKLTSALHPKAIASVALSMAGWNYADVKRATDDVMRLLANNSPLTVQAMFQHCITAVRQQYNLSSHTASTNLDDTATHNYIS